MCHLEKKHIPPPQKQQQKIYSVLYYPIKIAFLNFNLLCILIVNKFTEKIVIQILHEKEKKKKRRRKKKEKKKKHE